MRVVCINNKDKEALLKEGQEYTAKQSVITDCYVIEHGNKTKGAYLKSRFKKVEE